jgi:4-hydroxybenzoate polyprenyltransferase
MATPLRSVRTASLSPGSRSNGRHWVAIARHFLARRGLEVAALQASPFLGIVLGGFSHDPIGLVRVGLLLLGSLALTAHIFVLNDWAGRASDIRDPRRSELVYSREGISGGQVVGVAVALLAVAAVALAFVGGMAVLLGAVITILSLLYSFSSFFGKNSPVVGSMNHLVGGSVHFLLGYTCFHVLDMNGVAIGLFFGLVFAAGHLNQEIRDHEGDRLNGIRTSAVVFGCGRVFLASVLVFTAAYTTLALLGGLRILSPLVLLCALLACPLHVIFYRQAVRRGVGFETAVWMQRRYRLIFALIGLLMLAT